MITKRLVQVVPDKAGWAEDLWLLQLLPQSLQLWRSSFVQTSKTFRRRSALGAKLEFTPSEGSPWVLSEARQRRAWFPHRGTKVLRAR